MGIVRPSGREAVRLSTEARERAGPLVWSEARGVGRRPVVVSLSVVHIVAREGARHSAADRTSVRDQGTPYGEETAPAS